MQSMYQWSFRSFSLQDELIRQSERACKEQIDNEREHINNSLSTDEYFTLVSKVNVGGSRRRLTDDARTDRFIAIVWLLSFYLNGQERGVRGGRPTLMATDARLWISVDEENSTEVILLFNQTSCLLLHSCWHTSSAKSQVSLTMGVKSTS